MSDKPLARERKPIERVRSRLEALVRANAAPRCRARSKRTGKPCRGQPCRTAGARFMAARARGRAHAGGARAQQASKLETLAGTQSGTVAPAAVGWTTFTPKQNPAAGVTVAGLWCSGHEGMRSPPSPSSEPVHPFILTRRYCTVGSVPDSQTKHFGISCRG